VVERSGYSGASDGRGGGRRMTVSFAALAGRASIPPAGSWASLARSERTLRWSCCGTRSRGVWRAEKAERAPRLRAPSPSLTGPPAALQPGALNTLLTVSRTSPSPPVASETARTGRAAPSLARCTSR
jgi:hypothetical protein